MHIPDAIDAYLRQCAVEHLSPRTIEGYRKRLARVADHLRRRGVVEIAEVTADDLHSYLNWLAERGRRPRTLQSVASTLRSFAAFLLAGGRIVSNPTRDLPLPVPGEEPLPVPPLSEAEVADLFASLPRRNAIDLRTRAHLELLYGCALRLRESVQLDVSDIDLARRTVRVRAGKGGRERIVPLMQGVAGAVKDYLAVRRTLLRGPDHGALLLDRHGKRIEVGLLRAVLFQLGRKRGRRLHPHLFRHSIAVHLLRGGADVRHVQQFLGHANLETTKIYLRMVPLHLRADYDKAMPMVDVGLLVVQPPAGGDRPAGGDVADAGDDVGAGQDEHDDPGQAEEEDDDGKGDTHA